MYLDTDVVLAVLKADDWLSSEVDVNALDDPITSTATAIEIQYIMEDEWERERLASVAGDIADAGIDPVALTVADVEAAGELREAHDPVRVFDAIHLGAAWSRDEPIVSTDTLYPSIGAVEHVDPRDI